jgi:hypothetical protein
LVASSAVAGLVVAVSAVGLAAGSAADSTANSAVGWVAGLAVAGLAAPGSMVHLEASSEEMKVAVVVAG